MSSIDSGGPLKFANTSTNARQDEASPLLLNEMRNNTIMLDTTVERGYDSNRLSRIKSDRKSANISSGKLRFGSVHSASSSMDQ